MIKKKLLSGISAVLICSIITLSVPLVYAEDVQSVNNIGQSQASIQTDENGFEIENGVLRRYTGTATEVVIPEGVTSIGALAFDGCSNLTEVTIPKGVTSIGPNAFFGTKWIEDQKKENPLVIVNNIVIDGVTCSGNVTIPEGVTSIGVNAFYDCSSITEITIPESVTSIGDFAFSGCSSITEITIPESVTSIGNGAFNYCSSSLTICGKEGSIAQTYAADYNIPFKLLTDISEEKPSDTTEEKPSETTGEKPSETTKHEVTLPTENTGISSSDMKNIADKNKTQDVVIKSTDEVIFTFLKGTMKMIEGKDNYDFGVKITTDYSQTENNQFAKDDFAFRIDYNYEGELPGIAQISIPLGSKWIGKTLYYYKISDDGTYKYLTSAVVDENGIYTINQSNCSDYIAVTVAPKNIVTPTDTGDTDMVWIYAVLAFIAFVGIFAAGYKLKEE